MSRSLLATLRVAGGLFEICAETTLDALRSRVVRSECDERIGRWAARSVEAEGIDLVVEGPVGLLDAEAFVVMSNHQSNIDIPVLFHALRSRLRMVTKTEMFAIPVIGRAMHESGFVEVDRGDRAQAIASLRGAARALASGTSIWIAPEGTRSVTGEIGRFKKGGFVMACEAGARILPVGLWGTRDVLPPHGLVSETGRRVAVVVGEPIGTLGRGRDELMGDVRERLASLVARARGLTVG